MSFDLDAHMLSARLRVRQVVRRKAMLAKTAIHLEAEKARDEIKFLTLLAEAETEISRFRRQFGKLAAAARR